MTQKMHNRAIPYGDLTLKTPSYSIVVCLPLLCQIFVLVQPIDSSLRESPNYFMSMWKWDSSSTLVWSHTSSAVASLLDDIQNKGSNMANKGVLSHQTFQNHTHLPLPNLKCIKNSSCPTPLVTMTPSYCLSGPSFVGLPIFRTYNLPPQSLLLSSKPPTPLWK